MNEAPIDTNESSTRFSAWMLSLAIVQRVSVVAYATFAIIESQNCLDG